MALDRSPVTSFLRARNRFPNDGNTSARVFMRQIDSCQMLYFLPVFNNVKITFKIFKLKLLE